MNTLLKWHNAFITKFHEKESEYFKKFFDNVFPYVMSFLIILTTLCSILAIIGIIRICMGMN